jgi:penicillin-binding protein 1C
MLLLISIILDNLFPISLTPSPQEFAQVITAEDGTPLRSFADKKGIWRYPIEISEISPLYIQALVNYEDQWFWYHPGVNLLSIFRAIIQNFKNTTIISGGSTLTMQVARLISPHEKTITGKIKQLLIALQLEWHFSKEQILNYYLNHAPFGGTVEGIQAASYTYLGKSSQELSHAEAALLAGLPQAPSRNRPDRHPDRAKLLRNKILDRMAKQSVWTTKIVKQAKLEPIIAQHNRQPIIAALLARRLTKQMTRKSALKTTINIDMQVGIEGLVSQYIMQLPAKTSAAVLVVENQSLKVKTYIGSADFADDNRFGHIDMIKSIRSPGSTLKPFLYGIALDEGIIHSESLLIDAPLSFDGYKPQNFSRGFSGPVSVSHALKRSLNIPAVQVLHQLNSNVFVSKLNNAGLKLTFNQNAKPNLSVILGGVGTTLETLVGTYTALANGGLTGKIRFLSTSPIKKRYLFSSGAAWIINHILSHQNTLAPNALSWKTGTSYGYRDFWSIGVTPKYTMGVWIGRPDGTPLPGHYGAYTASPLLFSIAEKLSQNSVIEQPKTVVENTICWPLGALESETKPTLCHEKKQAWILNNNIPLTLPNHKKNQWISNPVTIQINAKTNRVINDSCDVEQVREKEIALWPLAVEPWIAKDYHRKSQIGIVDSNCKNPITFTTNELKIAGLENNTKLRSAGASIKLPRIKLQAQGGQGKYYWFINAHLKYTVSNNKAVFHQFKSTGKFQITIVDETGHSDSINLEVL